MTALAAMLAAGATLVVSTPGSGEMRTSQGAYPLSGLRYLRFADGRGALQFAAGSGAVALVGSQAHERSPNHVLLEIEHVVLVSDYPAKATCDARQDRGGGFTYIVCRGKLGVPAQAFSLRWRSR